MRLESAGPRGTQSAWNRETERSGFQVPATQTRSAHGLLTGGPCVSLVRSGALPGPATAARLGDTRPLPTGGSAQWELASRSRKAPWGPEGPVLHPGTRGAGSVWLPMHVPHRRLPRLPGRAGEGRGGPLTDLPRRAAAAPAPVKVLALLPPGSRRAPSCTRKSRSRVRTRLRVGPAGGSQGPSFSHRRGCTRVYISWIFICTVSNAVRLDFTLAKGEKRG